MIETKLHYLIWGEGYRIVRVRDSPTSHDWQERQGRQGRREGGRGERNRRKVREIIDG